MAAGGTIPTFFQEVNEIAGQIPEGPDSLVAPNCFSYSAAWRRIFLTNQSLLLLDYLDYSFLLLCLISGSEVGGDRNPDLQLRGATKGDETPSF